jgi:hypothetical protein
MEGGIRRLTKLNQRNGNHVEFHTGPDLWTDPGGPRGYDHGELHLLGRGQ